MTEAQVARRFLLSIVSAAIFYFAYKFLGAMIVGAIIWLILAIITLGHGPTVMGVVVFLLHVVLILCFIAPFAVLIHGVRHLNAAP